MTRGRRFIACPYISAAVEHRPSCISAAVIGLGLDGLAVQLQTRVLLLLRILFVMALHAVSYEAVARGAVAHAVIVANASHARVADAFALQRNCFVSWCLL